MMSYIPFSGQIGLRTRKSLITNCLLVLVACIISGLRHDTIVAVNAHPWYTNQNSCGSEAHPTSRRKQHASPSGIDDAITFKIQFTNPSASNEAQIGEDNRERTIPDAWDVGGNKYCKKCRMTITTKHVSNGDASQQVLTVSAGSLLEQGREMSGEYNSVDGVLCGGQRYDSEFTSNIHHYIWTAPDNDVGNVTIQITASESKYSQFKTNFVTLTYDESIRESFLKPAPPPLPPGAIKSPSPPPVDFFDGLVDEDRVVGKSGTERNKIIAAHGAVMLFTWCLFPPLVMYAGRFKDTIFGKDWFKVHKYLANLMLILFGVGLILANRFRIESRGRLSYPFEERHGLFGFVAVISLFVQPVLAYFRPAKFIADTNKQSFERVLWLWAHRLVTCSVVIFTLFSVRTGLEDYKYLTFGREAIDNIWNREFIFTWFVLAYLAIPILLEIIARRKRDKTTIELLHNVAS